MRSSLLTYTHKKTSRFYSSIYSFFYFLFMTCIDIIISRNYLYLAVSFIKSDSKLRVDLKFVNISLHSRSQINLSHSAPLLSEIHVFFLRFVKFNNCSLNLLFVVHLDNPKTLKNPCTLEPTDFQLYRKMKRKFYFRFSFFFAAKKRNWTSIFVFHFFPTGKETELKFSL